MKAFSLCILTVLMLQCVMIKSFALSDDDDDLDADDDHNDDRSVQRTKRGWSMIRLGRGMQTLRLGKRTPSSSSSPFSLYPPSSLAGGEDEEQTWAPYFVDRHRKRRQPPFPRYGRSLGTKREKNYRPTSDIPHSVIKPETRPARKLLALLKDMYLRQQLSNDSPLVEELGKWDDKVEEETNLEDSYPSLSSELVRAVKSVPVPRIGRRTAGLFQLVPPIPRAGRGAGDWTSLLQREMNRGEGEGEVFFRAGRVVPKPRIGRSDPSLDFIPDSSSDWDELTPFMVRYARAVPAPRVGRGDDSAMSAAFQLNPWSLPGSALEQPLSVSTKAAPTPRIGRRSSDNDDDTESVLLLRRTERAAPSPRIGRDDNPSQFSARVTKAAPSPRIGRADNDQRTEKQVPSPGIGQPAVVVDRPSKAAPSPRIGRELAAALTKELRAIPAPRIGRHAAQALFRYIKAIPAPRIGRRGNEELFRSLKAAPAPRIGRRGNEGKGEEDEELYRSMKAAPSPRIGRGGEEEILRSLKAAPAPRIGRGLSPQPWIATRAVPSPRIGRSGLWRSVKAVPSPRIGRRGQSSSPLLRFLKAVPSPRIGRQDPEEFLRSSKAVPSPRIGRGNPSSGSFLVPRAAPAPRIGRGDPKGNSLVPRAAPAPRIGRGDPSGISLVPKAAPAPRIGRGDSEEKVSVEDGVVKEQSGSSSDQAE